MTRDAISAPTEQLVFASGGRWFGVPSGLVQEIAVWNELTRIPGAPQHVLGVFSIRGEMYPVIDPGLLLGSRAEAGHRVVALKLPTGTLALTAGQLGGMSELDALPEPADDRPLSACFRGPLALQAHPEVLLVDTAALFAFLAREDG